jgi:hypothetical protein
MLHLIGITRVIGSIYAFYHRYCLFVTQNIVGSISLGRREVGTNRSVSRSIGVVLNLVGDVVSASVWTILILKVLYDSVLALQLHFFKGVSMLLLVLVEQLLRRFIFARV